MVLASWSKGAFSHSSPQFSIWGQGGNIRRYFLIRLYVVSWLLAIMSLLSLFCLLLKHLCLTFIRVHSLQSSPVYSGHLHSPPLTPVSSPQSFALEILMPSKWPIFSIVMPEVYIARETTESLVLSMPNGGSVDILLESPFLILSISPYTLTIFQQNYSAKWSL